MPGTGEEAFRIALEDLRQAYGSLTLRENRIEIKYFNELVIVSRDSGQVSYRDSDSELHLRDKVIILHYLLSVIGAGNTGSSRKTPEALSPAASDVPQLSGKLIDFREVPGGNAYYSVFQKRVHRPFLDVFGEEPRLFEAASKALGGEKKKYGDEAFRFFVLPGVPVDFVLYGGDDEFPPNCKMLFDSSIRNYLPAEDIVVICEICIKKLKSKITKI